MSVAEAVLDRAVTLNPSAAMAWAARGNVLALRNRPDAAIEALERARRLSPYDPNIYFNALSTALAHLAARRWQDALEWADRGIQNQPRMVTGMRAKTVAFFYLGRLDEARAELGRVLAIDPSLTIARYRATLGSSVASELFELIVAGLRGAGLPEG